MRAVICCEGEQLCSYWKSYKTECAFISFVLLKNTHPDKMITLNYQINASQKIPIAILRSMSNLLPPR